MTVQILRNILDRHADGYTMYLTLYAWENLGIFIWLITKIHYFLSSNFPETDFRNMQLLYCLFPELTDSLTADFFNMKISLSLNRYGLL